MLSDIHPLSAPVRRPCMTALPHTNRAHPALMSGGQGKCATTILADQGHIVTVITDEPYNIRSQHVNPVSGRKGTRVMHRSTLHIPMQRYTDYTTTTRQYQSGVGVPQRSPPYGSQHVSQFTLGKGGSPGSDWATSYKQNFVNSSSQHPSELHRPSFENRFKMSEGGGLKRVMTAPGNDVGNKYWSQYNRVHNTLGAKRGPGEPHERPTRHQYNPLTGTDEGSAWSPDNKRISGNRVLYNNYRKNIDGFTLG